MPLLQSNPSPFCRCLSGWPLAMRSLIGQVFVFCGVASKSTVSWGYGPFPFFVDDQTIVGGVSWSVTAVSWGCFVLDFMELQLFAMCWDHTTGKILRWQRMSKTSSLAPSRLVSDQHSHAYRRVERTKGLAKFPCDIQIDVSILPLFVQLSESCYSFLNSVVQLFDIYHIGTAKSSKVLEVWWTLSLSFCSSSSGQVSPWLHRWLQLSF